MRFIGWIEFYFYFAHVFIYWGVRTWKFAIGMYLVQLSPDKDLRLVSSSLFSMLICTILFMPFVGKIIDSTSRICAMRLTVISSYFLKALGSACLFGIIYLDNYSSNHGDTYDVHIKLCFVAVIVLYSLGGVATQSVTVCLHRDWAVVLSATGNANLTRMNAVLKQIDMISNVCAPILIGFIMDRFGLKLCAFGLTIWFSLMFVLIPIILQRVYAMEPALHYDRHQPLPNETDPLMNNSRSSSDDQNSEKDDEDNDSNGEHPETRVNSRMEESVSCGDKLGSCFNRVVPWKSVKEGVSIYFGSELKYSAFALAMVFLTVLNFSSTTNGFLLLNGMQKTLIATMTSASAVAGFIGVYIFLFLKHHLGLPKTAIIGLFLQLLSISTSTTSLFIPVWVWDKYLPHDSAHQLGPSSLTRLLIFCSGLIVSRAGLWIFDMAVVQQIQETIPQNSRGRFNSLQQSLQSAFELTQIIVVIILPKAETFKWLALVSCIEVALAFFVNVIGYGKYGRRSRNSYSTIGEGNGFI